jgi:TolA-binding protein
VPTVGITEKEKVYFELSGEKADKLNEMQIYEKVIEKYRVGDLRASDAFTHLLISKYPQSIFADNSLYMCGLLAIDKKFYGKALQSFNDILDRFPTSNKAVSALFAKGMLLKKMNLISQSKVTLLEVQKRFPGSPEFFRSDLELKIINK